MYDIYTGVLKEYIVSAYHPFFKDTFKKRTFSLKLLFATLCTLSVFLLIMKRGHSSMNSNEFP